MLHKNFFLLILAAILLIALLVTLYFYNKKQTSQALLVNTKVSQKSPDYLIVLVGDSMTESLGNSTEIRQYLGNYYPGKTFDIFNYGFGSTNILSLPERLTSWTEYGRAFQPILDINFNLIIIESFGHNPLSQYSLSDGLEQQTQTLNQVVSLIKEKRPNAKIAFLATLSPNRFKYGEGQVDLSDEMRSKWVEERISYIKNHIEYARSRNIPLINVFEKSQDLLGNGNIDYLDKKNYIHPSPKGIIFISKEIAKYIYKNNLLTN